ncbi:uncharacterized protein F5Z01DRAFT_698303 [Emericellopsis atlantica]|uniref:Uncharacterized protein n=1 Tax=Emericellopsis atlantica TaxID=2614577 RepID=A0A9P7ZQK2_9HYPO|nr:uncharacterized protein F5Z01DRAFT_698303 [Emericellopsis atlantica]KAG9256375.1 hypothetical protein F5Z01DRAFT_698303 [Emericellopsis atlantica]
MADEPSATDIASTIGTWLGVGLALFALIGIVGPVLAIDSLTRRVGDSFGYVSRGVWAGGQRRLLRQIRAPLLYKEPDLRDAKFALEPFEFEAVPTRGTPSRIKIRSQADGVPSAKTSSGWVQFGSVIEGYNVPMSTGDSLVIRDEEALLPVNTSWLQLTGLLGRYGPWQDKGRLPLQVSHGITSNQAKIDSKFIRESSRGSDRHHVNPKDHVFFSRHELDRIGHLGKDKYRVDDVQDIPISPEAASSQQPRTPVFDYLPRPAEPRAVHFDDSDDESISVDPEHVPRRRLRPTETSAAKYITPRLRDANATNSVDPDRPRGFCLDEWNEREADLSELAGVVHADVPDLQVLSLQEISLSTEDVRDINNADGGTYHERQSEWVRLEEAYDGRRHLRREDAQFIGLALLDLELSPHGYLMSGEPSACRALICQAASSSLPQLLARIMGSIDALGLEEAVKDPLKTASRSFYDLTQLIRSTRKYYSALHALNLALQDATPTSSTKETTALTSIGCVMLTSPEFRSLIAQSARLLSEGLDGSVVVDLGHGAIEMPTVMNFVAKFPIDTDRLFPDAASDMLSGTVTIRLARALLACLRAALRSAMFDTALDSVPLFEAVRRLDEVVLLG